MRVSGTHARCIQNIHEMHMECTRDVSIQAQNLAIKLHQDLINCNTLFHQMRNVSRIHVRCVWNISGTCERCFPDVCEYYLGAELYRTYLLTYLCLQTSITREQLWFGFFTNQHCVVPRCAFSPTAAATMLASWYYLCTPLCPQFFLHNDVR